MDIEKLMKVGVQRNEVFDMIPEASSRILDIGYGDGALIMRLKYQKKCTELYGVEHNLLEGLSDHLDGNWNLDITSEENGLDDAYLGYFNYIILHDVLEHIYNPWGFLQAIHKYLSSEGKCIIVTPNAQYWEFPYALLSGVFPYDAHGIWNVDHIRWYTLKSLIEVAIFSGYGVDEAYLIYPELLGRFIDPFQKILNQEDIEGIELPPMGWSTAHLENGFPFVSPTFVPNKAWKISYPGNIQEAYPYLLAVKLTIVCKKMEPTDPVKLFPGAMAKIREKFQKSFSPEYTKKLLPEGVKTLLERR